MVKVLGSKTDGPAILHCVGFQRYTFRRPTALLLYVLRYSYFTLWTLLFCGTLFEDRRPGCCCCCYRSKSDLLPEIHFAKQHWTCYRSCHTTLWMLSTTCCCYCCCCTSIAIYWWVYNFLILSFSCDKGSWIGLMKKELHCVYFKFIHSFNATVRMSPVPFWRAIRRHSSMKVLPFTKVTYTQ